MSRVRNVVQLRAEVRQRADMVNSAFVTDFEVDRCILQSCSQLYDEMCATGEDYFIKYVDIPAAAGGFYDFAGYNASDGLPATDVYQVRGVDAVYSGNCTVNLPRFNWEERNIYAATPALTPYFPIVAYRVMMNPVTGNDALQLIPDNSNGVSYFRVWYYPNPKNAAYIATITNPQGSPPVVLTPGTYHNVPVQGSGGMLATVVVDAAGEIQSVDVTSYTTGAGNAFPFAFDVDALYSGSPAVPLVGTMNICQVDGRAGWEEWTVVDAAMKLLAKEESDTSQLEREASRIWARIMKNMANRDAGQSKRITDVSFNSGMWPYSSSYSRRY